MSRTRAFLATALIALSLAGCSAQVRRDQVLESSGSKPQWAVEQKSYARDGFSYFVGEGYDTEGYPLAARMAKAAAAQSLAESTGLRIKSGLTRSAQRIGLDARGSYLQDTVAMATELVTVQELNLEADYREKILRADDDRTRYVVMALFKLPDTELKQAKVRALEAIAARAGKRADRSAEADARALLRAVSQEPDTQEAQP